MTTMTLPPGPAGHRLTGVLADLRADQLELFTRTARDYGDVATLRVGPLRWFLVSHPDLVEQVVVTRNRDFIRPRLLRQSRITFGDSMFVSSGEVWRQRRRLAQPAFHHHRIAAYGETMSRATSRTLARWRHGDRLDVAEEMAQLTLAIVGRTLFDVDVEGSARDVGAAMTTVMQSFTARMRSGLPLPDTLPTPGNLRNRRAIRRLEQLIDGFIARARAGGDTTSLLAMLVAAADEAGGISDEQLRHEALTYFLAGHETTAVALTWALYLISQHPEVDARLVRELDEVLGDREPTTADVERLPFTGAVLKETMRLYPPAYAFARDAVVEIELGGSRIPAGSTVVMSQWVLHRDPRFFSHPETFDPDRWNDGLERRLPRFAYFPFGGGPHYCIGASFALLEATLVLAAVVRQFRVRLVPGHRVELDPLITLRPRGGMPMRIEQRQPASGAPSPQ